MNDDIVQQNIEGDSQFAGISTISIQSQFENETGLSHVIYIYIYIIKVQFLIRHGKKPLTYKHEQEQKLRIVQLNHLVCNKVLTLKQMKNALSETLQA